MASYTWVCGSCGRHVPARVAVCHCGGLRELQRGASSGVPAAPFAAPSGWGGLWRSMPRDVKAMVATAALVLVAGLARVVLAPAPKTSGPALLGYVDRPPVDVPVEQPAFKLPWWK